MQVDLWLVITPDNVEFVRSEDELVDAIRDVCHWHRSWVTSGDFRLAVRRVTIDVPPLDAPALPEIAVVVEDAEVPAGVADVVERTRRESWMSALHDAIRRLPEGDAWEIRRSAQGTHLRRIGGAS